MPEQRRRGISSEGGNTMQRPQYKNEWNITSVLALFAFITSAAGGIYSYGQLISKFDTRIEIIEKDTATWRDAHEKDTANWREEYSKQSTSFSDQIEDLRDQRSLIDNLLYRIGVQEQNANNLTKTFDALREELHDLTGDIKVIREILSKLENNRKDASLSGKTLRAEIAKGEPVQEAVR